MAIYVTTTKQLQRRHHTTVYVLEVNKRRIKRKVQGISQLNSQWIFWTIIPSVLFLYTIVRTYCKMQSSAAGCVIYSNEIVSNGATGRIQLHRVYIVPAYKQETRVSLPPSYRKCNHSTRLLLTATRKLIPFDLVYYTTNFSMPCQQSRSKNLKLIACCFFLHKKIQK